MITTATTTALDADAVTRSPKRRLRRLLAGVVLAGVLGSAAATTLGASAAEAMTPAQSTSVGVVSTLINDVDNFWTANFHNWGVSTYYRSSTVHFYNTNVYACGSTLEAANSFACS